MMKYGALSYYALGRVFPRSQLRENPYPFVQRGMLWSIGYIPTGDQISDVIGTESYSKSLTGAERYLKTLLGLDQYLTTLRGVM